MLDLLPRHIAAARLDDQARDIAERDGITFLQARRNLQTLATIRANPRASTR